jgi:hypothetical protein
MHHKLQAIFHDPILASALLTQPVPYRVDGDGKAHTCTGASWCEDGCVLCSKTGTHQGISRNLVFKQTLSVPLSTAVH